MGYGDYNITLPEGENFEPAAERVHAFADLLKPEPFHLAEPGGNREAWEAIKASEAGPRLLEAARAAATEDPLLYLNNEIYHYTVKEQNRDRINPVIPSVRSRMSLLLLAECLEPDGKHIPQLEKDVDALERLDNWNHPNNDPHRVEGCFVDLLSVSHASKLVAMDHLLQDRLSSERRRTLRNLVEKKVLQPFEKGIRTGKDIYWWVTCNHNWNSVCMSEILGCALYLRESIEERAWYLALAEKVLAHSEEGFEESGFYTEGVSYWNYGFGHYVLATEIVRAATGGKVDWLQKPLVQKMSQFGARMEIQDGIYPSFADCKSTFRPEPWLVHWLNNRKDPARVHRYTGERIDPFQYNNTNNLSIQFLSLFHQEDLHNAYAIPRPDAERDWFEDVQYLICRPRDGSQSRMAATFKGGHNGVNHNHNDLGTFTILLADKELIADPGAEVYTQRTFSKDRYHGDLLNSFGHPVPVVAGQLQRPGKDNYEEKQGSEYFTTVRKVAFSDSHDFIRLDLTKAYTVDTLQKLHRTFEYHRGSSERVTVTDQVEYSQPESYETALITYHQWEMRDDRTLRVYDGDNALDVTIESPDGTLEFKHCIIEASTTPARLSWKLKNPVLSATITLTVTPAGSNPDVS